MSWPQHIGDLTSPCPSGHWDMCTVVLSSSSWMATEGDAANMPLGPNSRKSGGRNLPLITTNEKLRVMHQVLPRIWNLITDSTPSASRLTAQSAVRVMTGFGSA